MKKIVVLSIMVMVLGCASWAGAWSYTTSTWDNSTGPVVNGMTINMDFYFGETQASTFEYGDLSSMGSTVTYSPDNQDPVINKSVTRQVFLGLTPFSGSLFTYGTLVTLFDDNSGAIQGSSTGVAPVDYAYLVFFGNDFNFWNGTGGEFGTWTGEFDKYPVVGRPKTGISVCSVGIKAAPVPIPGAFWLLGSGIGALLIGRRKRKV